MAKSRRSINSFDRIQKEDSSWITNREMVIEEVVTFFKNLYGRDSAEIEVLEDVRMAELVVKTLSADRREEMTRSPTDEEIKLALWSIHSHKSPGPDGFTSCFFKESWDTVGTEVTEAVKSFFTRGKLLREWNITAVALAPKSRNATRITDFRPISCCTVLYKVIAKILAGRLCEVAGELVSCNQSGFVKGRNIKDNIKVAQDTVRKYRRSRISPRCTIKVDIHKAYDSICWDFLEQVMRVMNFPEVFIR